MNSLVVVESRGRTHEFREPGRVRTAVSGVVNRLSSQLARDLFRIGQALTIADRAVRRFNRDPFREIRVVVSLEGPDAWEPLRVDLQRLAAFTTHDRWTLRFDRLPAATRAAPEARQAHSWTVVNLFSDGLDSLCGAAKAIADGENPLFVSHVPPSADRSASLLRRLSERMGTPTARDATVGIRFTVGGPMPERSRRTRPIFFLSLAGAIAVDTGVPVIRLNENGVLAANLPLRVDYTAHLPTRHAHPGVLSRFEDILRSVWPHDVPPRIENPFLNETKGEEAAALRVAPHLVTETVTCEYARQQVATIKGWMTQRGIPGASEVKECGLCPPCLIRRAALHRADLPDPDERYAFDAAAVFRGDGEYGQWPLYSTVDPAVSDLSRFCQSLLDGSAADFMIKYLPFLAQIYAPQDVVEGAKQLYGVYVRFCREMTSFLGGDACQV